LNYTHSSVHPNIYTLEIKENRQQHSWLHPEESTVAEHSKKLGHRIQFHDTSIFA
jgi:hypothetical protein